MIVREMIARMLILIGCVFASITAVGQAGLSLNKSFPTPDAASLGQYGIVPTDLFTGQANISIPLYNIKYKELEMPISLQYSTTGHKVDDHPGWVGLGWTLKSGGVIYRHVNGLADEYRSPYQSTTPIGYLDRCGEVSTNFKNVEYIKKVAGDPSSKFGAANVDFDMNPDEFLFNFNGLSGKFYFMKAHPNAPLEIKVMSNSAKFLKVELLEIKDFIEFDDWYNSMKGQFIKRKTGRVIYGFKFTDDQGIQYIFGGDPDAIEFNCNGQVQEPTNNIANAWCLKEIISPNGYKINLKYKRVGRVFIQHKQRNIYFYHSSYSFSTNFLVLYAGSSGNYNTSGSLEYKSVVILNPLYLESITTPLQQVSFSSSKSNELDYPIQDANLRATRMPNYNTYTESDAIQRNWQKLNEIDIEGYKKVKFEYLDQESRRLQLRNISIESTDATVKEGYSFQYNESKLLPAYNSKKADHWGFYNGREYSYNLDYLNTRNTDTSYLRAQMLEKIMYPTGGYLKIKYESHYYKKIAHQFPFEVNTKEENVIAGGLRVKKLAIYSNSSESPVVKEYFYIRDYLNGGTSSSGVLSGEPKYHHAGKKQSSYKTGSFWTGGWSSTLSEYGKMIDNNTYPMSSTNGNHVTYSEVTEKAGNGFITHKFSNHDNGFHDKAPLVISTNFDSPYHEEGFISMQSYRGLITSEEYYNLNKRKIKSVLYSYIIDTENQAQQVPFIYKLNEYDNMSRASACVYYTKPPLLNEVSEIETFLDNSPSILTNKSYVYDANYFLLKEQTTTDSKGRTLQTKYKYPTDFPYYGSVPYNFVTRGMVLMGGKHMLNYPVETVRYRDGKVIGATVQTYIDAGDNIKPYQTFELELAQPLEAASYKSPRFGDYDTYGNYIPFIIDDSFSSRLVNLAFDRNGNVLGVSTEKGKTALNGTVTDLQKGSGQRVAYLWGYAQSLPIAEARDASYHEVFHANFEEQGGWGANLQYDGTRFRTGRAAGKLVNSNVSEELCAHSHAWLDLTPGVDAGLAGPKKFRYSAWVYSEGPSAEVFLFMKTKADYDNSGIYFTQVDSKETTETGKWVLVEKEFEVPAGIKYLNLRLDNNSGGTVWFDDVRLCPSEAQMGTYTYDPLVGMTSMTDDNGRTVYYEYDGFGRLQAVRDEESNLLKTHEYNYKSQ